MKISPTMTHGKSETAKVGMKRYKRCRICKETKHISGFHKNVTSNDGLCGECKPCKIPLVIENKKGLTSRYGEYQRSAKKRKVKFTLTKDEFNTLTQKPCVYCGEYNKKFRGKAFSGLDRIQNNKGYSLNNVNPCCSLCNYMKKLLTETEFLKHIQKVCSHRKLS